MWPAKSESGEVEAHLLRFAGVREVIVFGYPSALRNERWQRAW